jgi:hypothetical protein
MEIARDDFVLGRFVSSSKFPDLFSLRELVFGIGREYLTVPIWEQLYFIFSVEIKKLFIIADFKFLLV